MSILNLCLEPSLPLGQFLEADGLRRSWRTDGLRRSWRTAQRMADDFWRRWRLFHLPTLQKRHKWTGKMTNVSVGDLVLLKESNVARNQWPRARVKKVFPDKEGLVRRVEVVLPNRRTYVRDVRYLCPLESLV